MRSLKKSEDHNEENPYLLENVGLHRHTVGRNMDVKVTPGEFPVRTWRKRDTCHMPNTK